MTWTYGGNPAASNLDRVRFLIGDTDVNDQLLSDEEINFLISTKGSPERAAYEACLQIMAKLAREVDYAIGPEKVSASQRFKHYQELSKELRNSWSRSNASPSWADPSFEGRNPVFRIGLHDNPPGGSCLDG